MKKDLEFYETEEFSGDPEFEYFAERNEAKGVVLEHPYAQPGQALQNEDEDETQDERRKRLHRALQYCLGTAAAVGAAAMLNSNALHISLTAEEYLEAITSICGETEYTPEGYPIAYWEADKKILPVYQGLREKAGWTEEDRITIMMNESGIEAEAFGTETGFCINDKKLYYGELEDGLPNGEGIIYSFFHGYPEYGTGFWEDGYIEGAGRWKDSIEI